MTVNPEGDLINHPCFIAMYEDGTEDCFAVPECSLGQGPMNIFPS